MAPQPSHYQFAMEDGPYVEFTVQIPASLRNKLISTDHRTLIEHLDTALDVSQSPPARFAHYCMLGLHTMTGVQLKVGNIALFVGPESKLQPPVVVEQINNLTGRFRGRRGELIFDDLLAIDWEDTGVRAPAPTKESSW